MKKLSLALIVVVASLGAFAGCEKEFGSTATAESSKVEKKPAKKCRTDKNCPKGQFCQKDAKVCMESTLMNWIGDGMGRAMDRNP